MIAALIFALAASVSGIVHDSSGGVVAGAAVLVRAGSGQEQRVTTGPDGRFSVETNGTSDITVTVLAGGFAAAVEHVTDPSKPVNVVLAPATLLETVTVTPTRSEQRLGDVPASVNVVTSERSRHHRRWSPTTCCGRCRPSACSAAPAASSRSRRRRACRCAASGRAARAGRWCCSTAFRSTIRSAAGSTGRACRSISVDRIEITEDTTSSLYGNYAMGGVINIITSRPTRRTIEIKPQYGNHGSPKFDFFASDRWNKVAAALEGSFFNTDGFPIVADHRARADRQQRQRRIPQHQRQARIQADGAHQRVLPRRLLHRESQQRQGRRAQRHRVDDDQRRRPRPAARTRATSRRACSSTSSGRTSTSWR